MELYSKLARLYIPGDLKSGAVLTLAADQSHYLKAVLRKEEGDLIRIFNPASGEWQARLTAFSKKASTAEIVERLRPPADMEQKVHLVFAPIKKQRLDILIEKSVELGVTHLHPVYTERTQNRALKQDRLNAQVIEAAEQCERMTVPQVEAPKILKAFLRDWPKEKKVFWALEQPGLSPLTDQQDCPEWAFLIGPEGGFSKDEVNLLNGYENFIPITLGSRILRAETACFLCLSHVQLLSIKGPKTKNGIS